MAVQQLADPINLLDSAAYLSAQSVNFNSSVLPITQYSRQAIHLVITSQSSLNVTAKIQVSLDKVTWIDLNGTSVNFTSNTTYAWDPIESISIFM